MKTVALALSALVLISGAAQAANTGSRNERPETAITTGISGEKVEVRAGNQFSVKELARNGISANDSVSVTLLPKTQVSTRVNSDR